MIVFKVVAAGGIFDGRGLAMSLSLGAQAVWVGTRFVASKEGGAPMGVKKKVVAAQADATTTTPIFTGRPMRVFIYNKIIHNACIYLQ